ncbi:nuclear transport factor 2 family protein [Natrarchaeobius sp. A-rgal3]|uniref:nuclear transport factor 2 family protein n=1 Tax=Natrarchaeobius versutus TaxID=1679078 RepID=UPI003510759D
MGETHTMTDEQRRGLALEYFKKLDAGEAFFDLFAEDAQVYFPKWGVATGIEEIEEMFADVAETANAMSHDYATFNYVVDDETVVVEGTSTGEAADGTEWRPDGTPGGGRWCDVFEIRDGKIHRLFIYLDPDYAGADTDRYPWLEGEE